MPCGQIGEGGADAGDWVAKDQIGRASRSRRSSHCVFGDGLVFVCGNGGQERLGVRVLGVCVIKAK